MYDVSCSLVHTLGYIIQGTVEGDNRQGLPLRQMPNANIIYEASSTRQGIFSIYLCPLPFRYNRILSLRITS